MSPADFMRALHTDAWEGASAVLKVEPFILHVQCRSVAAAQRLMRVATGAGFRESGMSIGAGGKIVVAVRTTASALEVPLRLAGRNLVDAAYVAELAAITNERFREVGERRARFIAAFSSEYAPPPMGQAAATAAAPPTPAGGGGAARCSGCGCEFPTRNALFSRHLVAPTSSAAPPRSLEGAAARSSPARVCPHPRVAPAPPAAAASSSSAPPTGLAPPAAVAAATTTAADAVAGGSKDSRGISGGGARCTGCGGGFASRNQLYRHIDSCPPARARKLANAGLVESATAGRVSPAGAPLLEPSVPLSPEDLAASQLATARMVQVLNSAARQRADAVAASLAPARDAATGGGLTIDWEQLPTAASAGDAAALLARWGHTACVVQSGAAGGGPLVAVVGGYRCTGLHGRSADVVLFDPATRRVHHAAAPPSPSSSSSASAVEAAAVGGRAGGQQEQQVPPQAAPQPMTRHTATAVPAAAFASAGVVRPGGGGNDGEFEPILVLGGNNGPLKPLAEPWWLLIRRTPPATGGTVDEAATAGHFELQWVKAHVVDAPAAASPPPRWGHSASFVPACAAAGSPPAVVLCGGRDAYSSFDDVWCAELVAGGGGGGSQSRLPSIRWHRLQPDAAAAAACVAHTAWRGRFYHAAAVLDAPLPAAAATSPLAAAAAAASAAPTLVASIAVHGGYPSPYLVTLDADSSSPLLGGSGDVVETGCEAASPPPVEAAVGGAGANGGASGGVLLSDLHLLQVSWRRAAAPSPGHPAAGSSFVVSWVPVTPAATPSLQRGAAGCRPLEPRCSHSLLALGGGQLLVLGGECASPQHNAAQLLQLLRRPAHVDGAASGSSLAYTVDTAASPRADALGYAALDAEALASQASSVSAGRSATVALSVARDRVLPMLLRAAVVLLPAAASGEPGGAAPPARGRRGDEPSSPHLALFACGGGGVCFAFGSHSSPSYLAVVRAPRRAAALLEGGGSERGDNVDDDGDAGALGAPREASA